MLLMSWDYNVKKTECNLDFASDTSSFSNDKIAEFKSSMHLVFGKLQESDMLQTCKGFFHECCDSDDFGT